MKYLKTTIIGLLLFGISFLMGSYVGIQQYPKQEFNRVLAKSLKDTGGYWTFLHKEETIDADFKTVVKPAIDFLYSSAVLDADEGAFVLSIPPINRYWSLQFMEDDTDVFAYVGNRTHGLNKAVKVLIVPPNYKGETHGLETIELTTKKAWLLGRFQVFDKADAPNVRAIQEQITFKKNQNH